jgi:uncharacterized membrane protein
MKTNYLFKTLFFCLIFFAFIIACKHEPLEPTGTSTGTTTTTTSTSTTTQVGSLTDATGWKCYADTAYFQYDVLPILNSACATSGCHDDLTKESGYQLTTYANTLKKGVSAGKATTSKLYTEMANGSMPPRGYPALTQVQKDIVAKWINQGAKNLSCNPSFGTCDTTNVKFASFISPLVVNKCQGCHSATNAGGGIKLDNYAAIKASVQTGKFWGSMVYLAGVSKMPKAADKLPTCELNKIKAWIDRGALNN